MGVDPELRLLQYLPYHQELTDCEISPTIFQHSQPSGVQMPPLYICYGQPVTANTQRYIHVCGDSLEAAWDDVANQDDLDREQQMALIPCNPMPCTELQKRRKIKLYHYKRTVYQNYQRFSIIINPWPQSPDQVDFMHYCVLRTRAL